VAEDEGTGGRGRVPIGPPDNDLFTSGVL